MAAGKKPTRKELLKKPDEFITWTGRLIQFATRYRTHVAWSAIALLVMLVAAGAYRYYSMRADEQSFSMLREATAAYDRTAAQKGPETARQEVATRFEELIQKYSGRSAARLGRVVYAGICFSAGDTEKSIALYEEAMKDFETEASVRNIIRNGLGSAWEKKGDMEKAAAAFQQIVDDPNPFLKDEALFQLARINERMGNSQRSRELFAKIAESYPNSMYREIAREKAASLGG